ncbi:MAG: hypothetical protein ACE5HK_00670 [Candidatus Methylomirabilales bacterium]
MRKARVLVLTAGLFFLLGGISAAEPPFTWRNVVGRGMPDFNNPGVSHQASLATFPVNLSFPSGVQVVFVFVNHRGQMYGVYHDRRTGDVVGILRAERDPASTQGLHLFELYVDTGLLEGHALTKEFVYLEGSYRVFTAVCRIADLSREARAHTECPKRI